MTADPAPPTDQVPPAPGELEPWLREFIERLAEADAARDYRTALAAGEEAR